MAPFRVWLGLGSNYAQLEPCQDLLGKLAVLGVKGPPRQDICPMEQPLLHDLPAVVGR